MTKLKIVKQIIKENISDGECGLFDTRGLEDDPMHTLYDDNGLRIDICYYYSYFEVFGLTKSEFHLLEKYYDIIRKDTNK